MPPSASRDDRARPRSSDRGRSTNPHRVHTSRSGSPGLQHARLERAAAARAEAVGGCVRVTSLRFGCSSVPQWSTRRRVSQPASRYNSRHVDSEGRAHGPSRPAQAGACARAGRSQVVGRPEADRRHDRHHGRSTTASASPRRRCTRACASSSRGMQEDAGDDEEEPGIVPVPFINPEIVPLGTEQETDWEGCLSIPDIRGKVPRYARVKSAGSIARARGMELQLAGFPGARRPARERSPRRRAVLRPDDSASRR